MREGSLQRIDREHAPGADQHQQRGHSHRLPVIQRPRHGQVGEIAIGRVGNSGRAKNEVAPNSPSEIVKAKSIPARIGRQRIGRVISRQMRPAEAPNTAADSFNSAGMEASAGWTVRVKKGSATTLWAMGTSKIASSAPPGIPLESSSKPNPRDTAHAPSGSVNKNLGQGSPGPAPFHGCSDQHFPGLA